MPRTRVQGGDEVLNIRSHIFKQVHFIFALGLFIVDCTVTMQREYTRITACKVTLSFGKV